MAKTPSPILPIALCLLGALVPTVAAQEIAARQSLGISSTFAPDSSHILIGTAERRRTWTAGIDYDHIIWSNRILRLDYEGSIAPFFQERDPTLVGEYFTDIPGFTSIMLFNGQRVIYVNNYPLGSASSGGPPVPIYPLYGSTKTYAAAISPIGARITATGARWIRPTFSTDMGIVVSSDDLPVDDSASLNYMFSFGPGIELSQSRGGSIRLEYLYRHISNANSGYNNPGIDQGVIRLTLVHSFH